MTKRFSSSLLLKVLKVQVWSLKNRSGSKLSRRITAPKLSETAFFKLPPVAQAQAQPSPAQTSTPYRLQFERPDGARLTLTLPSLDAAALNALVADFLRGSSR